MGFDLLGIRRRINMSIMMTMMTMEKMVQRPFEAVNLDAISRTTLGREAAAPEAALRTTAKVTMGMMMVCRTGLLLRREDRRPLRSRLVVRFCQRSMKKIENVHWLRSRERD